MILFVTLSQTNFNNYNNSKLNQIDKKSCGYTTMHQINNNT